MTFSGEDVLQGANPRVVASAERGSEKVAVDDSFLEDL